MNQQQQFNINVKLHTDSGTYDDDSDWYVAYLDILGVSQKLKKNYRELAGTLKNVCRELTYKNLVEHFRKILDTNEIGQTIEWNPVCRVFSDNIIIGIKCPEDRKQATLVPFLCYLIDFQYKLLTKYSLIIRGGVTRGKIIFEFNKNEFGFVIGPALVDAYEIEKNIAKDPRIVVNENLVEELKVFYGGENFNGLITLDEDGCYYVDYISMFMRFAKETRIPELDYIKSAIRYSEADLTLQNVKSKYDWLEGKVIKRSSENSKD